MVAFGVDHPDPLGMAPSHLVIALGDQALQLDPLALEPVGAYGGRSVPPRPRVDAEQDRQVGPDAAGRQIADLLDALGSQPSRHPLVGDARIAEAIADHVAAGIPGRADHLRDQLGARRAEEQQLGERVELQSRVLEQPADPLAGLGAARLAHQHDVIAERPGEQLGLGRLPRPVDSLE